MGRILKIGLVFFSILFFACNSGSEKKSGFYLNTGWKFRTGDSLAYAAPDFDDSKWDSIMVGRKWEEQGYANYDGYAWYRIKFNLPSSLKDNSVFKDSIEFLLGKIDDCDQTFLNGKLIGQNGDMISVGESEKPGAFEGFKTTYSLNRSYVLSVFDPRIEWDKENVIAIRVNDPFGGGGMYTLPIYVGIKDIRDYVKIDYGRLGLNIDNSGYVKKIFIQNKASFMEIGGELVIRVIDNDTKQVLFDQKQDVVLKQNEEKEIEFSFKTDSKNAMVEYIFTEGKTKHSFSEREELPYILTPFPAVTPRINGAKVFGVRPGSPFLFRVSATGVKPIVFSAEGLPAGLTLDATSGIITGKVDKAGEYKVILKAKNDKGEVSRDFRIVVGNKLCLTPPLGWNSWNCWGLSVDEDKVKASADNFVKYGLADHGWTYINIDDGWEAPARAANGAILTNEKFKDMKGLVDYIHSLGLKMGIYSSPGPKTCGGYLGSYQHEEQDAKTYANWGIDYLKYDWCSYSEVAKGIQPVDVDWGGSDEKIKEALPELQKPYILMEKALQKQKRDIVHSLCQYGWGKVWEWGGQIGAQLWRTTGDIEDTWASMSGIGFRQNVCAPHSQPGNWNDPDMLVVGMVGWGPTLHPSRLTASEQYTHISLWALLSAPMLIGCDLSKADAFTLNLLCNDEVIDIDQDPLGKAAIPVVKTTNFEIWVKDLEDGSKAVGMFNMLLNDQTLSVDFKALGLEGEQVVRDVWRQKDLGTVSNKFESKVLPHGVCLVRLIKK